MITLALLGDVMLGRAVNAALRDGPPEQPWGDTLPLLHSADLRVCNLECVMSDRGEPWSRSPKTFHFRSDARNVEVLRRARIDAVTLANNHVLDFEQDALRDMLGILDAAGVARAGAGRDAAEAGAPAVLQAGGLRVGILAFTDNEPEWAAGADRPGTCYVPAHPDAPEARDLARRVERLSRETDAVIVSAHWGPNWGEEPPPGHVDLARALVRAGARIVFGHSPHVFRGIERTGRSVILYSAGDFIDDYAADPVERNDWSAAFLVELGPGGAGTVRVVPTVIGGYQARLATGSERDAIGWKLHRLCRGRRTEAEWREAEGVLVVPPGSAGGEHPVPGRVPGSPPA
jgi:poly-gamma-glutamate synthesis protein (capsule biosynthesis protein)